MEGDSFLVAAMQIVRFTFALCPKLFIMTIPQTSHTARWLDLLIGFPPTRDIPVTWRGLLLPQSQAGVMAEWILWILLAEKGNRRGKSGWQLANCMFFAPISMPPWLILSLTTSVYLYRFHFLCLTLKCFWVGFIRINFSYSIETFFQESCLVWYLDVDFTNHVTCLHHEFSEPKVLQ